MVIQIVKTDRRIFQLQHDIGWGHPLYHTSLCQLDLLRIMRICKKSGNDYYYNLFKRLIDAIDEYTEQKTDYDRELPRTVKSIFTDTKRKDASVAWGNK